MINIDSKLLDQIAKIWNKLQPQIVSIGLVFLILSFIIFYYYSSIKKIKSNQPLRGFALLIFSLIMYFRTIVREILGKDFVKITPLFLMMFSYILLSNIIGIIGFENPTSSLTVTLSLGLITFIGIFVVGFRYQRISFLSKFTFNVSVKSKKTDKKKTIPVMINPIEIIGTVSPLISISFRLWGNIFAGGLIMNLFYALPVAVYGNLDNFINFTPHPIMIVGSILAPPLNIFLDLLTGFIQALLFVLLTMVYWSNEKNHEK